MNYVYIYIYFLINIMTTLWSLIDGGLEKYGGWKIFPNINSRGEGIFQNFKR